MPKFACANEAAKAVGLTGMLEDSSEEEYDLSKTVVIIRTNKTIVPNQPVWVESNETVPWTSFNYLSTFPSYNQMRQAVKPGVGYAEQQVCGDLSFAPQHLPLECRKPKLTIPYTS